MYDKKVEYGNRRQLFWFTTTANSPPQYHHRPCHHLCLSAITYRLSLFQTIDKQQKAIGYIYLAYSAIEIER